jgi:hypothetical protein
MGRKQGTSLGFWQSSVFAGRTLGINVHQENGFGRNGQTKTPKEGGQNKDFIMRAFGKVEKVGRVSTRLGSRREETSMIA